MPGYVLVRAFGSFTISEDTTRKGRPITVGRSFAFLCRSFRLPANSASPKSLPILGSRAQESHRGGNGFSFRPHPTACFHKRRCLSREPTSTLPDQCQRNAKQQRRGDAIKQVGGGLPDKPDASNVRRGASAAQPACRPRWSPAAIFSPLSLTGDRHIARLTVAVGVSPAVRPPFGADRRG
jgi:hypothetical protein